MFGLIFTLSLVLVFLSLQRFIKPAFQRNPHKTSLLISSAVFASITCYLVSGLIFDWRLVPKQAVTVEVSNEKNPLSSAHEVNLSIFESNFGVLSFNEFTQSDEWVRTGKSRLENGGKTGATLEWQGRPGAFLRYTFLTGPDAGIVQFSSSQGVDSLDLFSSTPGETSWEVRYPIPTSAYLIPLLAIWVFCFCVYLVLGLVVFPFTETQRSVHPRYWLLFTLPMVLVWGFYLLTYWPGVMSPDSIVQWGQILSGKFTDTHPAIHTMLLWMLTRGTLSPAPIAIAQILLVSFSVAWGLGLLYEMGLNLPAAWLLAVVFAFSPINSTITISIWKDIPYSAALFLFSVQVLKIILSNGEWLNRRLNLLAIFVTGLSVMLFRHNGIPVPILSLVVLIFFYRPKLLRIGAVIVAMIVSWLVIRGPIYDLAGVSKAGGLESAQMIHHISAHVIEGSPLTAEEQSLADILLPDKVWDYNCCRIDETDSVPGFSWGRLADHPTETRSLFLMLLAKEPMSTCRIWPAARRSSGRIKAPAEWWSPERSATTARSPIIPTGLVPQPVLPQANVYLTNLYNTVFFIPRLQFYWYPVIYLILVILGSILLSIWKGIRNGFLFCVPAVIQSLVLALVSLNAADFRYQYGVFLLGLFSLGLIAIAVNSRFSKKASARKNHSPL